MIQGSDNDSISSFWLSVNKAVIQGSDNEINEDISNHLMKKTWWWSIQMQSHIGSWLTQGRGVESLTLVGSNPSKALR